jgi:lysophospholipase L1-like esterase
VICLGGSSTFGFHNTDTGTYPYQLQQLFGEPINGFSVEVINGGFPYYTTASVRSLLEAELASYDPDLITPYAAYNDASWPLGSGSGMRFLFWISQHSMIYLVMKETCFRTAGCSGWEGSSAGGYRRRPIRRFWTKWRRQSQHATDKTWRRS